MYPMVQGFLRKTSQNISDISQQYLQVEGGEFISDSKGARTGPVLDMDRQDGFGAPEYLLGSHRNEPGSSIAGQFGPI